MLIFYRKSPCGAVVLHVCPDLKMPPLFNLLLLHLPILFPYSSLLLLLPLLIFSAISSAQMFAQQSEILLFSRFSVGSNFKWDSISDFAKAKAKACCCKLYPVRVVFFEQTKYDGLCLFIGLSIHLSIDLSFFLSVCLFRLSFCLSVYV